MKSHINKTLNRVEKLDENKNGKWKKENFSKLKLLFYFFSILKQEESLIYVFIFMLNSFFPTFVSRKNVVVLGKFVYISNLICD